MRCIVFLFFIAVLSLINGCSEKAPVPRNRTEMTGEGEVIMQLNRLLDIVYDEPDIFLNNPDSFSGALQYLPITPEGKELRLSLLLNMAYVLRAYGRVLPAIRFYEQGLNYYMQLSGSRVDFYEHIVKPLGSLYTITGDFDKARLLQDRAIDKGIAERRTDILPSLYGNQAITLSQMGRYDSVIALCRSGLVHNNKEDATAARLYNEMANCYLRTGRYDSAVAYNDRSVRIFEVNRAMADTVVWFAASLMLKSELAKEKGEADLSLRSIDKAIRITERQFPDSRNREKAKFYLHRAILMSERNEILSSLSDFEKARHLLAGKTTDILFPDNTITDVLSGMARCYWKLGQKDTAVKLYIKTIENDYRVQQFIVSKESNYFNSANNRTMLNEVLNKLSELYEGATKEHKPSIAMDMLWCIELSKGRQLLLEIDRANQWLSDSTDNVVNNAKKDLRYLWNAIAVEADSAKRMLLRAEAEKIIFDFNLSERHYEKQFQQPDYNTFMQYVKHLSRQKDIVSWCVGSPGNSWLVTVHHDDALVHKLPLGSAERGKLGDFLKRYFYEGPEAFNNHPTLYYSKARDVLAMVMPGHDSLDKKDWLLSPDGMIYAIPFDALCRDQIFIAMEKNIVYTYTLLLNLLSGTPDTFRTDIRLFSRSVHDDGFSDLRYVQTEQHIISDRYVGQVYRDAQANDSTFTDAMNSSSVLHIATHAVADSGYAPYIVLSDKITIDKIDYTASKAPLVVLSACQTASGELVTAEGMESLNRAFLSKGIKGVIASQWPVNDDVVVRIMALFYDRLSKGHFPDRALADAKRDYLNNISDPEMMNPWYWAAMNYTGVPVYLVVEKKTGHLYWYISGVLLLGASVLVWGRWRKGKLIV